MIRKVSFHLIKRYFCYLVKKNPNMFCHHCARQSSKHKVNKTHAELIEIPILYIPLTHLCFSTYNFKLLYTTWRFICSYLLESFMLVLRVFLFFFTCVYSFTVRKPLNFRWRQLFFGKIYTDDPQNVLQLNTTVQIIVDILFAPLNIFTVCIYFLPS